MLHLQKIQQNKQWEKEQKRAQEIYKMQVIKLLTGVKCEDKTKLSQLISIVVIKHIQFLPLIINDNITLHENNVKYLGMTTDDRL